MKSFSNKIKKSVKIFIPSFFRQAYRTVEQKILFKKYIKRFQGLIIGKNVHISQDCFFGKGVKIYDGVFIKKTSIDDYTYVAPRTQIGSAVIGKYCSIGPDVKIGLGMHPSRDMVSTHPAFFSKQNASTITYAENNCFQETIAVSIENDVWIGANALIKDGVHIGNGAIIGASALVVKNVEPYSIVGGVPAKLIRYRFTKEEIAFLQNNQWWDKPEKWKQDNWRLFLNIKNFIKAI